MRIKIVLTTTLHKLVLASEFGFKVFIDQNIYFAFKGPVRGPVSSQVQPEPELQQRYDEEKSSGGGRSPGRSDERSGNGQDAMGLGDIDFQIL